MVHRDISPQNIFVTLDGATKLLDFGIARSRDRIHATTTGVVKGKYAYMAPESLREGAVTTSCDIWSLGVVMWEAFTGRRLFRRAEEGQTITAVLSLPAPAPSTVEPSIPDELDELVLSALERNTQRRSITADVIAHRLATWSSGEGVVASRAVGTWMRELFPEGPPAPIPTPLTPPTDELASPGAKARGPRRAMWIIAPVLALVASAGAVWWTLNTAAPDVSERQVTSEPAIDTDVSESRVAAAADPPATPDAPDAAAADAGAPPPAPPAERRVPMAEVTVVSPTGWAEFGMGARSIGNTPRVVRLPVGRQRIWYRPNGVGPRLRAVIRVHPTTQGPNRLVLEPR